MEGERSRLGLLPKPPPFMAIKDSADGVSVLIFGFHSVWGPLLDMLACILCPSIKLALTPVTAALPSHCWRSIFKPLCEHDQMFGKLHLASVAFKELAPINSRKKGFEQSTYSHSPFSRSRSR